MHLFLVASLLLMELLLCLNVDAYSCGLGGVPGSLAAGLAHVRL